MATKVKTQAKKKSSGAPVKAKSAPVEYDNEMRGVLFGQNKTDKAEGYPDFKGSVQIDGIKYWLSGWKKTSQSNQKYMSLAVQQAEDQEESTQGEDVDL